MIDQVRLAKLPVWAQEEIKTLTRQRDTAVTNVRRLEGAQKESPFWVSDWASMGEDGVRPPSSIKRYFDTSEVNVSYAGVHLRVSARENRINLQWGTDGSYSDHVALVPASFQNADLIAPIYMRTR